MDTRQIDPFEPFPPRVVSAPAPPPPAPPGFSEPAPIPVLTPEELATLTVVPASQPLQEEEPQVPAEVISQRPEPAPAPPSNPAPAVISSETTGTKATPATDPFLPTSGEMRDQAKMQRLRRYQQQEEIRAPKVQIDQKIVLWLWIAGIAAAFISSAIVSYNGITGVAEFVGLSQTWMAGLFFFFIELMYLLFLVAYLVLASRVDDEGRKEKTFGAIMGMFSFGAVAVAANAFHTINYWEYNWLEPRLWAGTVLSVAAPLAIISASKMASRVVFARAIVID